MKHQRAFKYAAVGAAVLIPTLVIAQQRQTQPPDAIAFDAGRVLTSADVKLMRQALVDVITRVNTLDSNAGPALTKDRIYAATGPNATVTVADGAAATASSSCNNAADVMLTCGCFANGSTRQIVHNVSPSGNDNPAATSTCRCDTVSSGTTVTSAVATCLRTGVP